MTSSKGFLDDVGMMTNEMGLGGITGGITDVVQDQLAPSTTTYTNASSSGGGGGSGLLDDAAYLALQVGLTNFSKIVVRANRGCIELQYPNDYPAQLKGHMTPVDYTDTVNALNKNRRINCCWSCLIISTYACCGIGILFSDCANRNVNYREVDLVSEYNRKFFHPKKLLLTSHPFTHCSGGHRSVLVGPPDCVSCFLSFPFAS